jgi:hypothetical protein
MLTICHVLAVHEPTDRVLATLTPLGWLLPTMISPDIATSGSLLARATTVLSVPARPRCQANLQIDRASGSANVTLVVDVTPTEADDQRLVPVAALRDTSPVVSYQASALPLLPPHSGRYRSAFLEPDWIRGVADWVASVTGEAVTDLLEGATVHRAEIDRAVVEFETCGGRWHFKGDMQRPFVEALVTRHVAAQLENAVVPTKAFDETRGWWLTSHVEGVPLHGNCWPAHLNAVATWSRLQHDVRSSHDGLSAFGVPTLSLPDLDAAATDALDTIAAELRATTRAVMAERISMLLKSRLAGGGPQGLLHFDAAARNVLWNGHAAVFLDLESLCIGPAVIAGELMARRMRTELSIEQRQAMARAGASAALRLAGDSGLEGELWRLPALTDLCLLAVRRRSRQVAAASDPTDPSAQYSWRHVARDFAARVSSWPSSANELLSR